MRKLIALFLSLMMVLSCVPALAENEVLSSEFDGKQYVPVAANIPLTIASTTVPSESDITVTADGVGVTDFELETADNLNYTVSFAEEMTPDTDYTVSYGGESISFHTSYNVKRSSVSGYNEIKVLDKPISNFTAKISQTDGYTATEHKNSDKSDIWYLYAQFYDANENYMWLRQLWNPAATGENADKIALHAYYYEKSSGSFKVADRLVCYIPLAARDVWATYKDGIFYIYALDADGNFNVYGTFDMAAALTAKGIDSKFVTTGFGRGGAQPATIYIGDEFMSASSTLDTKTAVPVASKIPIDFTGKITADEFSVNITANGNEVDSSLYAVEKVTDYRYLISFNENMEMDAEYEITVSSEKMEETVVISYTTSFDNTRFTTTGTVGHTLAVPVNEYSVSLELSQEIPLNSYWGVRFHDTSSVQNASDGYYSKHIWLGVQRPNGLTEGTYRIMFYYYNNYSSSNTAATIGDRVFATDIPVSMCNLYFTFKDGVYYIYGKEADGTYKHLNTYDAKSAKAEIADFTWDKVAAWNTQQITISGGDNLGDIISLSSKYDGYVNVPVDSVVPVSFDGEISLAAEDFAITADGEAVTDFTVKNTDGNNYAITFNSKMAENAKYVISSRSGSFNGEVSFTTAFAPGEFEIISSETQRGELVRTMRDITMHFSLNSEKVTDNMDAYIYLSDTASKMTDSGDNADRFWIRLYRARESGVALDEYHIFLYRYENNELAAADRTLVAGLDLYDENEFVITMKNYVLYLYVKQADGSYVHKATYNMTSDSTTKPLVSANGFEFGAISVRNSGGAVTINAGYADTLTAEATDVNAESGSTITLNFNNEIASAPETVTIGGVTAAVSYEGKTATLTLNGSLAYLTDYTVDISDFEDIFGQKGATVGISTPRMSDMYSISNVKMLIDGAEESTLKAGTLTFSMDCKRNFSEAPDTATVVVALYEKTGGKLYLKECKSIESSVLEVGGVQTGLKTPALTVPQAVSGTEYSVMVMVWKNIDSAFPLTAAVSK